MIDEDYFDNIKDEVADMYGSSDEWNENHGEIHLGKRSGGWKFLFNPNYERYYPLTKEGLMNFLKRDDVIIYTEYFSFREDDDYSKREKENIFGLLNNLWIWLLIGAIMIQLLGMVRHMKNMRKKEILLIMVMKDMGIKKGKNFG